MVKLEVTFDANELVEGDDDEEEGSIVDELLDSFDDIEMLSLEVKVITGMCYLDYIIKLNNIY